MKIAGSELTAAWFRVHNVLEMAKLQNHLRLVATGNAVGASGRWAWPGERQEGTLWGAGLCLHCQGPHPGSEPRQRGRLLPLESGLVKDTSSLCVVS